MIPTITTGAPTGKKSSRPNACSPASLSAPLTMILAVVNNVAIPPRIVPKASGMSKRAGEMRLRRVKDITAGSNTPTAEMLFMNKDKPALASITSKITKVSFCLPSLKIHLLIRLVAPVCCNATETIEIPRMVMTAELLKPEKTCLSLTIPEMPSANKTINVIRSARRRVKMNKKMAMNSGSGGTD